ncbi:MAG: DUF1329 domain-containing protein [Thermodesulfobacteriota bacterium]|nr:DUF1329 domain-containing protein [Thermodesulfobacteriota bacterium]
MRRFFLVFIFFLFFPCIVFPQVIIKPGIVINRDNLESYVPSLKSMLPACAHKSLISGIQNGWITLPVVQNEKNYPCPKGFAKATKKYAGTCKIGPKNELIGYVAGIPFPEPKTGAQLAWNCFSEVRRQCSEDIEIYFNNLLFDKNSKKERSVDWILYKKKWKGRTDIPPIPEMPGEEEVLSKESIIVTDPFDAKGFAMIRIRFENIEKPDNVYSYIPAIRRIRRLTGSDLTDPLLGTDEVTDDFEVWRQKINPKMHFKFVGKSKYLVPKVYLERPSEPFLKGNLFQVEWEIRELMILEIKNEPDYAYSKRVIYSSSENNTYLLYNGENFDQKGRLHRSDVILVQFADPETFYRSWHGTLRMDNLSGHSTVMLMYPDLTNKVNIPLSAFTMKYLLGQAR